MEYEGFYNVVEFMYRVDRPIRKAHHFFCTWATCVHHFSETAGLLIYTIFFLYMSYLYSLLKDRVEYESL